MAKQIETKAKLPVVGFFETSQCLELRTTWNNSQSTTVKGLWKWMKYNSHVMTEY